MRQIDPSTLDSRLMLRLNKDLWSVITVQDCLSAELSERQRASTDTSPQSTSILGKRDRETIDLEGDSNEEEEE